MHFTFIFSKIIGSTTKVVFVGGPTSLEKPFFNTIQYDDKKLTIKIDQNQRSLFLTCLDYHKQSVGVLVGSNESCSNSKTSFLFVCNSPSRLLIYHDQQVTYFPSECPKYITSLPSLPILLNQDDLAYEYTYQITRDHLIPFRLAVVDNEGNIFDSFDSIDVKWKTSSDSVELFEDTQNAHQKYLRHLLVRTGEISISVESSSYDPLVLQRNGIAIEKINFMRKELKLNIIPQLSIDPPFLNLYNKKDSSALLKVLGGSGINKIEHNHNMIQSTYQDSVIKVNPLKPGKTKVYVHDKCINQTAESNLNINQVASFLLRGVCESNKIQLESDSSDNILTLFLIDNFGNSLHGNILSDLKVKIISSDNIEVVPLGISKQNYDPDEYQDGKKKKIYKKKN